MASLCLHIYSHRLVHFSRSVEKLIATIETTLASASGTTSGDSVQHCLAVLMVLSSCPILHSNSANKRGIILGVARLDAVKLQAANGVRSGTGYTRFGGTRRSLLVEKEVVVV